MDQEFTISGIAKVTGLDRRSIARALIGVDPVRRERVAGKVSEFYDRDEASAALAAARLPLDRVMRLAPFGGSVSRIVAWNTLEAYVAWLHRGLAIEREKWPAEFGVTPDQAALIAGIVLACTSQVADLLLAEFGKHCPETVAIDDALASVRVPARDAEPGAFMALQCDDPPVAKLYRDAVAAKRRATKASARD